MAGIGQTHEFSSLSHNEEVISYLQVEGLKAKVTNDALAAVVLKLKSS